MILSVAAVFLIIASVFLCIGHGMEYERVDTVYINEVIQSIAAEKPVRGKYDYTYFDRDGEVVYSTVETAPLSYEHRLSKAIGEGDTVVDYGEGKVVFYIGARQRFERDKNLFVWFAAGACIVTAAMFAVCAAYLYGRTVRPFNKLKDFAMEVAGGNLDSPLILDRYGSFGAFGEAFDIMRNNLKESRFAEQKAASDRRKLMQEIGHDIKTPLASIKAVAECAAAQGARDFDIIIDKASTIENLVNGFYQSALEEEGQLGVYMTKHTGKELAELIDLSDYNSRVVRSQPPVCELLYDKIRMGQILDNVIANSYKYADTAIDVRFDLIEGRLITQIRDSGEGVSPEQLNYIMDRFYRGEKSKETSGQGLGLHICKKLVARMGGDMSCENDGGFVVRISLPVFGKN